MKKYVIYIWELLPGANKLKQIASGIYFLFPESDRRPPIRVIIIIIELLLTALTRFDPD
jgi:hypothetical protein